MHWQAQWPIGIYHEVGSPLKQARWHAGSTYLSNSFLKACIWTTLELHFAGWRYCCSKLSFPLPDSLPFWKHWFWFLHQLIWSALRQTQKIRLLCCLPENWFFFIFWRAFNLLRSSRWHHADSLNSRSFAKHLEIDSHSVFSSSFDFWWTLPS